MVWTIADGRKYEQVRGDDIEASSAAVTSTYAVGPLSSSVVSIKYGARNYAASSSMNGSISLIDVDSNIVNTTVLVEPESVPRLLTWCDIDSDGKPELIIPLWGEGYSSIKVAKIDFDLLEIGSSDLVEVGYRPRSSLCVDIDKDADFDVVSVNNFDNTITLLLNQDGVLNRMQDFYVGDNPGAIDSADIDLDGDMDLAVSNREDDTITFLFQGPNYTFDKSIIPAPDTPKDHELIDLDGIEGVDLVYIGGDSHSLGVVMLDHGVMKRAMRIGLSGTPHGLIVRNGLARGTNRFFIAVYPNWVEVVDYCSGTLEFVASIWLGGVLKHQILELDFSTMNETDILLANARDNQISVISNNLDAICQDG